MIKGDFVIVDGNDLRIVFDHIDTLDNGITIDLTANTFTIDLFSISLGKWFSNATGEWDSASPTGDCDFVLIDSVNLPGKFEYVATGAALKLVGNAGIIDGNIISSSQASTDDDFDFSFSESLTVFEIEKSMTDGKGKLQELDQDVGTIKNTTTDISNRIKVIQQATTGRS